MRYLLIALAALLVLATSVTSTCTSRTRYNYHVGVMMEGQQTLNAIQLALEYINATNTLLDGDFITVHTTSGICDEDVTPLLAAALQDDYPNITAVLGPGCSDSFIATNGILARTSTIHMSLEATSPDLFDATSVHFPWALLMVPSDRYQTDALVAIVSKYGWQRVGVLSTNYQYGSDGHQLLDTKLARLTNMYVFKSPDLPWNSTNVTVLPILEKAKLENVRCFIVFDYPEFMAAVMEAAYSLGMYGSGYAWLGSEAIGAVDPLEWVTNSRIAAVAKGSIIMQQTPSLDTFEQLQFVARYNARLFPTPYETVSSLSALAYDAIMTLAYGIRDAKIANGDTSCSSTSSSSTDSITTRSSVPSQSQIFTAAQSVSFAGASGAISFSHQALPGWHYAVHNMQGISLVRIGAITEANGYVIENTSYWPGGGTTPPDLRNYPFALVTHSFTHDQVSNGLQVGLASVTASGLLGGATLVIGTNLSIIDPVGISAGAAVGEYLVNLPSTAKPIAVIGPEYSTTAEGLLSVLTPNKMPAITIDATSSALNEQTTYPYFVRTQRSAVAEARALVSMALYLGFKRIAVLGTDDLYSATGVADIIDMCLADGITVAYVAQWAANSGLEIVQPYVQKVVDLYFGAAIVYCDDCARYVIKAFYDLGQNASEFAILVPNDSIYYLDQCDGASVGTSLLAANESATMGVIAFERQLDLDTTAQAAMDAFQAAYEAATFNNTQVFTQYSAFVYDAVWLLAYGMATVATASGDVSDGVTLEAAIRSQNFIGATGSIYFKSGSNERQGTRNYYKLRAVGQCAYMGSVYPLDNNATISNWNASVIWAGLDLPEACPAGSIVERNLTSMLSTCVPVPEGYYSSILDDDAIECPSGSTCPFGSLTPLPLTAEWRSPYVRVSVPDAGSIADSSKTTTVTIAYGASIGGVVLLLIITVLVVAFSCKRFRAPMVIFVGKFDVFLIEHPTAADNVVRKRTTTKGGIMTILFLLVGAVVAAFLIHSWVLDRYLCTQVVIPGVVAVTGKTQTSATTTNSTSGNLMDLFFVMELIGMDEPASCTTLCETLDIYGTGIVPVKQNATTLLRHGSLTSSGLTHEGTFSCMDIDASSESEVGCRIKWVPAAADLYNILPDSFSLQYTFCNTKAQAIHWHMGSTFFTGQEFSAVGLLAPDNNTVLQGATANSIELSIQPTLFIGTTYVYESAPSSKTRGYSGYLLEATPGSETDSDEYFSARDSTPDVSVTLSIVRQQSVLNVSVAAKDPQGVALLSSISAFLGAIFAATRVLLGILERFDDPLVVPSAAPPPYDADKDKNTSHQQDKDKVVASPTQAATGGGQQREISPHHGDNAGYQPISGVASPVNSMMNGSYSSDQLATPSVVTSQSSGSMATTTTSAAPITVELIKPHAAITLHLDDNKDTNTQHYNDDPVLVTPRSHAGAPKSRSKKGNRNAISPRKRSTTTPKSRSTSNNDSNGNRKTNNGAATTSSSSSLTPRRAKLTSIPPSATDEVYEEGVTEDGDDVDPTAEMKRQSRKQHQQPRTVDACNVRMCM